MSCAECPISPFGSKDEADVEKTDISAVPLLCRLGDGSPVQAMRITTNRGGACCRTRWIQYCSRGDSEGHFHIENGPAMEVNVIGGRAVPRGRERHASPDHETLHGAPQVARRALAWARDSPCDSRDDDLRAHRSDQVRGTRVPHR